MRTLVVAILMVGGAALAQEIPVENSRVRAGRFEGRASYVPWSGIWWPMADGYLGIGWNGTRTYTYSTSRKEYVLDSSVAPNDRSPLAKYDAFVKARTGTDPQAALYELTATDDFMHHVYGDEKKRLDREHVDYSWWGHCNGWAAAAALEAEPFAPVEAGGIRFDVADLKGLLTESHFGCRADFSGTRYDKPSAEKKADFDRAKTLLAALDATPRPAREYRSWYERAFDTRLSRDYEPEAYREALEYFIERYTEEYVKAYEDIRPDVFHKILATIIGSQKSVVVFDISANEQVWNYPAFAYETTITDKGTRRIDSYSRRVFECRTVVHYADDGVSESLLGARSFTKTYRYELYATTTGYLRGGAWLGDSVDEHPDFAWFPKVNPLGPDDEENVKLEYRKILEILPKHHAAKDRGFEIAANGTSSGSLRGESSPITWGNALSSGSRVALTVDSSLDEAVAWKFFEEEVTYSYGILKSKRAPLRLLAEGMSAVVNLSSGTRMIVACAYDSSGRLVAMDEIAVRIYR